MFRKVSLANASKEFQSRILHVSTDPGIVRRDLETLRSYNQIVRLDADRLPRIVLEQDLKKGGDWSSNL